MFKEMQQFVEQIYRNKKNYGAIAFLDRDGTIIHDVGYLSDEKDIQVLPKVCEGIRFLNKRNVAVVIITNQPVVARGMITISQLKKINDKLVSILKDNGANIDGVFSCPHHPEKDFQDIPKRAMKYRISCLCRKPGTAMFEKAVKIYSIKNVLGYIGDREKDMVAAKRFGIRSIFVGKKYWKTDSDSSVPDFLCTNFFDAVQCFF